MNRSADLEDRWDLPESSSTPAAAPSGTQSGIVPVTAPARAPVTREFDPRAMQAKLRSQPRDSASAWSYRRSSADDAPRTVLPDLFSTPTLIDLAVRGSEGAPANDDPGETRAFGRLNRDGLPAPARPAPVRDVDEGERDTLVMPGPEPRATWVGPGSPDAAAAVTASGAGATGAAGTPSLASVGPIASAPPVGSATVVDAPRLEYIEGGRWPWSSVPPQQTAATETPSPPTSNATAPAADAARTLTSDALFGDVQHLLRASVAPEPPRAEPAPDAAPRATPRSMLPLIAGLGVVFTALAGLVVAATSC